MCPAVTRNRPWGSGVAAWRNILQNLGCLRLWFRIQPERNSHESSTPATPCSVQFLLRLCQNAAVAFMLWYWDLITFSLPLPPEPSSTPPSVFTASFLRALFSVVNDCLWTHGALCRTYYTDFATGRGEEKGVADRLEDERRGKMGGGGVFSQLSMPPWLYWEDSIEGEQEWGWRRRGKGISHAFIPCSFCTWHTQKCGDITHYYSKRRDSIALFYIDERRSASRLQLHRGHARWRARSEWVSESWSAFAFDVDNVVDGVFQVDSCPGWCCLAAADDQSATHVYLRSRGLVTSHVPGNYHWPTCSRATTRISE